MATRDISELIWTKCAQSDIIWDKCAKINDEWKKYKNLSINYHVNNHVGTWSIHAEEISSGDKIIISQNYFTIFEAVVGFREFLTKQLNDTLSQTKAHRTEIDSEIKNYQSLLEQLTQHDTDPSQL